MIRHYFQKTALFIFLLTFWVSLPLQNACAAPDDEIISAIYANNNARVQQLLNTGANPNAFQHGSNIPLLSVCVNANNLIALNLLLDYEADPNIYDNDRMTPLMYAVTSGNIEAAKILVQNGANIHFKNTKKQSPLSLARSLKNENMVNTLLNRTVRPIEKNSTKQPIATPTKISKPEENNINNLIKPHNNDAKSEVSHEINKYSLPNLTLITSVTKFEDGLFVQLQHKRFFTQLSSDENTEFQLINIPRNVSFTKKTGINLFAVKNNEKNPIPLKKSTFITTTTIMFDIKKSTLANAYEADYLILELSTKDNNKLNYIISKDVINDWKYVMDANLKQIRAELEG